MGLMQRLAEIFSGKAHRILDQAEDPRETLDLSY
ncbi:MAG: PspA/IM30 family protein, partial [Actinobacteria bacterium]|nr:PspA/IM30 family protein [Actinomycetota bacterium]